MLEARGVEHEVGGFRLRGVDLRIDRGEVVALIGPNGAGKSTLLRVLAGLEKPLGGSVLAEGEDLYSLDQRRRARLVGYVPPSHSPAFQYSVLDFALMGVTPLLGLFEAPGGEHVERARELLESFGLGGKLRTPYTALSSGELRLLLIARALMAEPRYILMDEPTAHLDISRQSQVLGVARRLARGGMGVLLVLHDPIHAYYVSDRVVALRGGAVVAEGAPEEVVTEETLRTLYGGGARLLECGWKALVPEIWD